MEENVKKQLMRTAVQIRKGVITAVASASSGHPGGSLSITDIMTYLYFVEMKIDLKSQGSGQGIASSCQRAIASPAAVLHVGKQGLLPC
jgi:transketolase